MHYKTGIRLAFAMLMSYGCAKNKDVASGTDTSSPPVTGKDTVLLDTLTNRQVLNTGIIHSKGFPLKKLAVIAGSRLSDDEKVLVATLQGLVAKTSSEQVYIDEGGPSTIWTNFLTSHYGITLTNYTSLTDLLTHFKNNVKGYVLYDRTGNPRSLTAATSVCGPLGAIAVTADLEKTVRSLGITTKRADVRTKDEKWLYANAPSAFSKQLAAEQSPSINHHLRDYITLTNAFAFYDGNTPWRTTVLKGLASGAFCFGYGQDEFTMVSNAAQQGIPMLPTDLAANLAPLSSVYDTAAFKQHTAADPVTEENVHYVCFMTSDGDNIAFNLWSLNNYFNNPVRGSFNMGYTISPSLADLAPAALRWYYEKAATGTGYDYFVAGPSGSGYTYPSQMPAASLDAYLVKLNALMGASGLRVCNILDQGAIGRTDLWNKYLAQPNIEALIYTGYGEAPHGSIQFSANGKPIIEQRDNLWQGLEEEAEVISNVNARPANPHSAAGYTLVFVHAWTKDLSSVQQVIAGFNANVRVVTPDAFVKLIKANLH